MTDLLYQTDSYVHEFDAKVVTVDAVGSRVALTAPHLSGRRRAAERPWCAPPCTPSQAPRRLRSPSRSPPSKRKADLVWHTLDGVLPQRAPPSPG